GVAEGEVAFPDLDVAIPPIGVTVTNPALANLCRIPLLTPGSLHDVFAAAGAKGPFDCQEVPTGRYTFNVLSGVAGGEVVADAASPTGENITGGQYSSQTWSVPNELGVPAQFLPPGTPAEEIPADCSESPCASAQGIAGSFLVFDPDPATLLSRRGGDAVCQSAVQFATGTPAAIPFPDWQSPAIAAFVAADTSDAFESPEDVQ